MKLRRCCLPNYSTTFRHGPSGHISSGLASARARAPLNFITSAIGRGHLVQHHNIFLVSCNLYIQSSAISSLPLARLLQAAFA